MSTYFSTVINDKAAELLRALINTGLYGDGETEVVGNMLLQGIREAVAHGFVEQEDAEIEDPEAPVIRAEFKCQHCEDGLIAISDETPDGKCPKCGGLIEIPF